MLSKCFKDASKSPPSALLEAIRPSLSQALPLIRGAAAKHVRTFVGGEGEGMGHGGGGVLEAPSCHERRPEGGISQRRCSLVPLSRWSKVETSKQQ